jgi:hypothetical protein
MNALCGTETRMHQGPYDLNAYFCDILILINQGEVSDNLEALDIIMLPECLRGDLQCHRVNAM